MPMVKLGCVVGSITLAFGLLVATVGAVANAAHRHWQTGTCTDAGVKRTALVGAGSAGFKPFEPAPPSKPAMPEVATYVIETNDSRFNIEDVVPLGSGGSLNLTVDGPVTFAVEGKTMYVRDDKQVEHRLRVTKKSKRPKGD